MSTPTTPVEPPAPTPRHPLHSRYLWAAFLCLALGLCAAALVWHASPNQDQTVGTIRVEPDTQPALTQHALPNQYQVVGYVRVKPYIGSGLAPIDLFEAFVDTQIALLQSPRVLDQAGTDHEWLALGRNSPRWGAKIPTDQLSVSHPAQSELIVVRFTDSDPRAAASAVKAILKAYETVSGDVAGPRENMKVLEDLRTTLTNQKRALVNQILSLTNNNGPGQQDQQIRKLQTEQEALAKKLDEVSTRIDTLNLEATMANRISIVSYGELPTSSSSAPAPPSSAP